MLKFYFILYPITVHSAVCDYMLWVLLYILASFDDVSHLKIKGKVYVMNFKGNILPHIVHLDLQGHFALEGPAS